MHRRVLFLFAMSLMIGTYAYAQKAEAHEFATIRSMHSPKICDSYLALYAKLRKEPELQGYVFLYGRRATIRLERRTLARCVTSRDYDPPRITLVEAPPKPKIFIVMWILPPGADKPLP